MDFSRWLLETDYLACTSVNRCWVSWVTSKRGDASPGRDVILTCKTWRFTSKW